MGNDFRYIDENLKKIRYNIAEAAAKYRSPEEQIRLMAVTKTVSYEAVNHAVSLGVELLGENRVQEYQSKKNYYSSLADVHFIGHLQTNKVKYIVDSISMIQSIDSLKLASEINRLAEANGRVMDVLCEVNVGGEESKSGVSPDELEEFVLRMSEMKNIRVRGLMTIPPPVDSDVFLARMQEFFLETKSKKIGGTDMDVLSMGMTHDYVQAVKYGSTLVRIGTGLFGARVYK
ncbi:MAG: YggS family pyridoxal phosphate-dependent enzyme [Ruminococcus sp.]|nr:YggS family pyridoxal phosphate-dependent enzyme [Ruminococcus sp.]